MKKLLSMLLAAAMIFTLFVPVSGTADPPPTRDADIFDALDILKHIVGMVELSPVEKYDHNENGVIDIFDALEVLKGLVSMRAAVQMPRNQFPVCECDTCNNDNNVDFQVFEYIKSLCNYYFNVPRIIRSWEELNTIFLNYTCVDDVDDWKPPEGSPSCSFCCYAYFERPNIDKSFFEDKALILIAANWAQVGNRIIVNSLSKEQKELTVCVRTIIGSGERAFEGNLAILAVNRADLEEVSELLVQIASCGSCTDCRTSFSRCEEYELFNDWLGSRRL
jgi:hypothetical protein